MPEDIKFNNEELEQVQNIQKSYLNVQQKFGQLKLAKLRLNEQEIQLEDLLKKIQKDETTFLSKITDKYGDGTLNPETGVFTPNKSE